MKLKYIMTAAAIVALPSCDDDEVFKKEQYKNVFAFVCNSDNINSKMFSLSKDESVGYLSFSMGGTNATTKDVTINIVEDEALINTYNKNNYDMEVDKYAVPMPKGKYSISSSQCVIKAGSTTGVIPMSIRPAGLSPDTTYFIAVRVDSFDEYELNPEKDFLMYQVYIKNKWADGDGSTAYTLRGKRKEVGSATEISMPGTKTMSPLEKDKVRIMAGNETSDNTIETFNKYALVLEIGDDGKVAISPFRDMEVEQLEGDEDYPNIFFYEDDGFNTYKTFLLHYTYKSGNKTYEMKEELRLQYNPDDEEEEDE